MKTTTINRDVSLPGDWAEQPLKDLAAFDKGHVVATQPHAGEGFMPYIGAESFGGHFSQFTNDKASVTCACADVLILWDGERSGLCASGLNGAIGSTVVRLRPRNGVDGRYLFHQVASHFPWIQARRTGTGVPHVPKDLSTLLRIPVPTQSAEQSRIAAILDTVDEAIAKTEAVIAKLRQVRAGLLHDLLNRGLDQHGQLRDPIAHPEQFQDSPVGSIPREWRVCGVLDVGPAGRQAILTGPFGAQLGQRDFVSQGVPVLRIGNVQAGYIDWSNTQFVTPTKAIELKRFSVIPGDLLFARQGATTGRNALADEKANGALINYHIIRVATDRSQCEPIFLHALFNHESSLRQINRDKGRGTREGINTEQIMSLRFALPSIDEQRLAVAVLSRHDEQTSVETANLTKLQQLKSGLMTDLLTGRVRVPGTLDVDQ